MLLIIIIVTKIVLCVGQTGMRILGYLYYLLVNAPPGLPPGGEEGFTYLMGLNMAFPKSENLRTSFRWTPLGFTTRRGRRVMSKPRTVTQLINSVFFCYLRRLQRQHALQSLRGKPCHVWLCPEGSVQLFCPFGKRPDIWGTGFPKQMLLKTPHRLFS